MGDIRATDRNKVLGLLADAVQGVYDFGSKPFGYENPPVKSLLDFAAVPSVAKVLDEISYGNARGLFTGSGMTLKPKAETMDAAMALAPIVAAAPSAINSGAAAVGKRVAPMVEKAVPQVMQRGGQMSNAAMSFGLQPGLTFVAPKSIIDSSSKIVGNLPKKLPQRGFDLDYNPESIGSPNGSALTTTIDGDAIQPGAIIAGRRSVGGPDQGFTGDEIWSLHSRLGSNVRSVDPGAIGGDAGRFKSGPGSDGEVARNIFLRNDLTPKQTEVVFPHEVGHLIDSMVYGGGVSPKGISRELAQLYSDHNSTMYVPKGKIGATPESLGYTKDQSVPEQLAEAFRVYMQDPNTMKTLYPNVAKRIRESVNNNTNLNKVIQFNSLGGLGLMLDPDVREGLLSPK